MIFYTFKDVAAHLGVPVGTLNTWTNLYDTPEPWRRFISSQYPRLWHHTQIPEWESFYTNHLATRNESQVRRRK